MAANCHHRQAPPAGTTTRELAGRPSHGAGIPWPSGFARMNLLVVRQGKPVPRALVTLSPEAAPIFDAELDGDGAARTDDEGRLSFYARPTRMVSVMVREPNTEWSVETMRTTSFAGTERDTTITFPGNDAQAEVEIRVVSERTGAPLAAARMEIVNGNRPSASRSFTDADGRTRAPSGAGQELLLAFEGYDTKHVVLDGREESPHTIPLRPTSRCTA